MEESSLYVRFGLHKDRLTLEQTKSLYQGIVVPAHILSYSQDATVAAVNHISHDYYIDPMSYVLTSSVISNYLTGPTEDSPNKKRGFKPSIKKMVESYGIYDYFQDNDFRALTTMAAERLKKEFVQNSIKLQLNRIDDGFASAFKKYSRILNLSDTQHSPNFVTAPYFYFDNTAVSKDWYKVTLDYAHETAKQLLEQSSELSVVPILATKTNSLTQEVIDDLGSFGDVIVWINDLDEAKCVNTKAGVEKLKTFATFIHNAAEAGISVSNLYGGYFSILCSKLGLASISNGIFYGEYKDYKTKIGGGGPTSRYYINAFHKFYQLPVAIGLFLQNPELLEYEPAETRSIIKNDPRNIASFEKKPELAQAHFLRSRKQEFENMSMNSLKLLLDELVEVQGKYGPLPETLIENDNLSHLSAWANALAGFIEIDESELEIQ